MNFNFIKFQYIFLIVFITSYKTVNVNKKLTYENQKFCDNSIDVNINTDSSDGFLVTKPIINEQIYTTSTFKTFHADHDDALIGDEIETEQLYDNVFLFTLDKAVINSEFIEISYELSGIQDHTGIKRRINDGAVIGGKLVKLDASTTLQKEFFPVNIFNKGLNRLTFFPIKNLLYEIKKLKIREVALNNHPGITFKHYIDSTGVYIKGVVSIPTHTIIVNGAQVPVVNNEFEFYKRQDSSKISSFLRLSVFEDNRSLLDTIITSTNYVSDLFWKINEYKTGIHKIFKDNNYGLRISSWDENTFVMGLEDSELLIPEGEIYNVTGGFEGFRVYNLNNATDSISIPYDISKIPQGYSEDDIYAFYFDELNRKWQKLEKLKSETEGDETKIKRNKTGDYINGIIKLPEAPNTSGFTPTALKDIKPANPTTGITMINPPSATNRGDANLSFPLKLPQGRQGMQPDLRINYSSEGGNSWLGLGWDLNLPHITIDTRWGVPRYDDKNESETYILNGEMLSDLTHRDELLKPRSTSNKVFHRRIEGQFDSIVRHGGRPGNYWWEIINKDGTRHFYGGTGSSIDSNAVLVDKDGNIAYWALTKSIDLNDNTVIYEYEILNETGSAFSNQPGSYLYPKSIFYTGHKSEKGKYKVEFKNNVGREDISVNARLGFKQVMSHRCESIKILFNNEQIRRYEINYEEGAFNKMLLSNIIERDENDNEFYRHSMEYFDEVRTNNKYSLFADETNFQFQQNSTNIIDKIFKYVNPLFSDRPTIIGSSISGNYSLGIGLSIGLSDFNWTAKTLTLGGSYNVSFSESTGVSTLMDIDGDGLPDKIYKDKDNKLKFKKNISYEDIVAFENIEKNIYNISDFSKSKTKTTTKSIDGNNYYFRASGYKASIKTTSSVYPTDFNGDGLVDMVDNGRIHFNTVNNGLPSFVGSADSTENRIISGKLNPDLIPTVIDSILTINENPLRDIVRFWEAPRGGRIKISAPIKLIETDLNNDNKNRDGIRATIQIDGDEKGSIRISNNDYSTHNFNFDTDVNQGTRIFFRLQSVYNGQNDQVLWDPMIEYVNEDKIEYTDANKLNLNRYKASEDFLISMPNYISVPYPGDIIMSSKISKQILSDDIELRYLKIHNSGDTLIENLIYSTVFKSDDNIQDSIVAFEINLKENESIGIKMFSQTNVDWKKVDLKSAIKYRNENDTISIVDSIGNSTSEFNLEYFPINDFLIYNKEIRPTKRYFNSDSRVIKYYPRIEFQEICNSLDSISSFTITAVIKNQSTVLGRSTAILTRNRFSPFNFYYIKPFDLIETNLSSSENYYIEFYSDRYEWTKCLKDALFFSSEFGPQDGGVFTQSIRNEQVIFGPLYRGWGHFSYGSNYDIDKNEDRATRPIKTNELNIKVDEAQLRKLKDEKEGKGDATYSPNNTKFNVLIAFPGMEAWMDGDTLSFSGFIKGPIMQAARFGEDDLEIEKTIVSGESFRAMNKVSFGNSTGFSAGLELKYKDKNGQFKDLPSGTYSQSSGSTTNEIEILDLNGDRYPDFISQNNTQITNQSGALQNGMITAFAETGQTYNSSNGISTSGSVTISNSNNTQAVPAGNRNSANAANVQKDAVKSGSTPTSSNMAIGINSNASFNLNDDDATMAWIDMNGDGLPDRVTNAGQFNMNMGYRIQKELINSQEIRKGEGKDFGGGASLSGSGDKTNAIGKTKYFGSISVGYSLSRTENKVLSALQDINGDGLPDIITGTNPMRVKLNKGFSFDEEIDLGVNNWDMDCSESNGQSYNGTFTIGIPIYLLVITLKLAVNPNASKGKGVTRSITQLSDFNGDGYPDLIKSSDENSISVRLSKIGKTNLLKNVNSPLNAQLFLDYDISKNTYEMPSSKWLLTSVKKFDGFTGDGIDTMAMKFHYDSGYYSRREREFFGFRKVTTEILDNGNQNALYRKVEQTYNNRNYTAKGLLERETLADSKGNLFNESKFSYKFTKNGIDSTGLPADEKNWIFPQLTKTEYTYYEGGKDSIKNVNNFIYDRYGNVVSFTDDGDANNLTTQIEYRVPGNKYIKSIPTSVRVLAGNITMRRTESFVDQMGNVKQITKYNGGIRSDFDFLYDTYGNLVKMTKPVNHKGQRMTYNYTYDDEVRTFTTVVVDAHGLETKSKYDFKHGQVLETQDCNDQILNYELDDKGRVILIRGPYERNFSTYSLKFQYHPTAPVPYAITNQFDPEDGGDRITYTFTDGANRVIQNKTSGYVSENGDIPQKVWIVSGRQDYDSFGRILQTFYPVTESTGNESTFNSLKDAIAPTRYRYDILDRPVEITLPDNAKTSIAYDIAQDYNKNQYFFKETITDAENRESEKYTDARDRVRSTRKIGSNEGEIWTTYFYDGIDQLIKVRDDEGNEIINAYDELGRLVSVVHPDAGTTNFTFDPAGNKTSEQTAVLASWSANSKINYYYDHERISNISYPLYKQNEVKYHYGNSDDKNRNANGRIKLREDGSGGIEYFYGRLGEVNKEIRTIYLNQTTVSTYISEYQYDTWQRMQSMTYPDGEIVDFVYDQAGKLTSMSGKKENKTYHYLDYIFYDKFQQKVQMAYGNGAVTRYSYEPNRRRLENLSVSSPKQNKIMNQNYFYDKVDNIYSITNDVMPERQFIGGQVSHQFKYDNFYRLRQATGNASYIGSDTIIRNDDYTLIMSYDKLYNIDKKKLTISRNGTVRPNESYEYSYEYTQKNNKKTHTPLRIEKRSHTYDLNGNHLGWVNTTNKNDKRNITWDEANRIRNIEDQTGFYQFSYDANSERVVKSKSRVSNARGNAKNIGIIDHGTSFMAYISPYLVVRDSSFIKHYFVEGQRILVKDGVGKFVNKSVPGRNIGLTAGSINYYKKAEYIETALAEYYKNLGLAPGHPSEIGINARPDIPGGPGIPDSILTVAGYYNPPRNWPRGDTLPSAPTGYTPGHPIWILPEISPDSVKGGYGFVGDSITIEKGLYYYHPDHLGSSNYITNDSGKVIQWAEYIPFGELFIDTRRKAPYTKQEYLYNGKELDESGLYYYGARYYDPKASIWENVDPKAQKYPGLSPYNYVSLNPMKFIDRDGREKLDPELIESTEVLFEPLNIDTENNDFEKISGLTGVLTSTFMFINDYSDYANIKGKGKFIADQFGSYKAFSATLKGFRNLGLFNDILGLGVDIKTNWASLRAGDNITTADISIKLGLFFVGLFATSLESAAFQFGFSVGGTLDTYFDFSGKLSTGAYNTFNNPDVKQQAINYQKLPKIMFK